MERGHRYLSGYQGRSSDESSACSILPFGAFDASPEMCRLASILTGQPVLQKTFGQFDGDSCFDGVWGCASLLHLTLVEPDPVLERLCRALINSGAVMFMSFELRNEEWDEGGRHFNGYDQSSFEAMTTKHPSVHVQNTWISDDVRPARARSAAAKCADLTTLGKQRHLSHSLLLALLSRN